MRVRVVLVLFVLTVTVSLSMLAAAAIVRAVRLALARKRPQFSLRTMLIAMALASIFLSAVVSWNYWSQARFTWLDPTSPEAAALVSEPTIVQERGEYWVTYRPRFRSIEELKLFPSQSESPPVILSSYSANCAIQEAEFRASSRASLEAQLSVLQTNDVLQPGWYAIRGRVLDLDGRPVSIAIVCISGPAITASVRNTVTRDDGSFFLPIPAPSSGPCHFRIYAKSGPQDSHDFSLDPAQPVMNVLIHVP